MRNGGRNVRMSRRLAIGVCILVAVLALGQLDGPAFGSVANARETVTQHSPSNAGSSLMHARHRHRHRRHHHRVPQSVPTMTSPTTHLPGATSPTTVALPDGTTPSRPPAPAPAAPRYSSIVPGSTGSFEFNGYAPLADRPLRVWYDAPAGDLSTTKVIVVMHGQGRTGESYRDSWLTEARRAGALLIVPEFSDALYPGSDAYNLGNVESEPPSRWSYAIIEPLFDFVQADTGNRTDGYLMYGHSAGAQFVHRFLLLTPMNRVKRAVIANAGWYTAPETDVAFPYGLRGGPVTDVGLRRALATQLTVLLGENDTDPADPDLRHTSGADRQGPHRFARGSFFFQSGLRTARALAAPFGWTLQTVPGVAHSNSGMVPAAARVLFG